MDWVKRALADETDFGESLRGSYGSALSAARKQKELGGVEGVADMCFPRIENINFAQRGDLISYDTARDGSKKRPAWLSVALGVCVGTHAAFVGPSGLNLLPLAVCRKAWRI